MKKYIACMMSIVFLLVLSGCLYPNERRAENQIPYPAMVESVQSAVDQFQEANGVLPIATRDADTPLYEKYVIEFQRLVPRFLEAPPNNSFERGGIFQYVLVDVEEDPTVMLLDLRLTNAVRDLQQRVNQYLRDQYLPVESIVDQQYVKLDYEALNLREEPTVQSPYSMQELPFIVDSSGRVGIDYKKDLYYFLEQSDFEQLEEGKDIRSILYQSSLLVPAHSFPYVIENGEIILK
ncbi:hypothetical protein [Bacillus horti]|uniref:ABC transporter periplasmic binding protein yphF n=1 Tax=Caldalkalibacillus horti TaxID=77523 RepID=A0ABT9W5K1_9BACI|nr:hypothetical protein [Bacillus horti]MDQ0168532.1 hypothetical protein [Bacillus horti]